MKSLNNMVSTLLALAMLAPLGAGAYYGIKFVINFFSGIDTQVANIFYSAFFVVLLSACLIVMIVRWVRRQNGLYQLLLHKAETNGRFVEVSSVPIIALHKEL